MKYKIFLIAAITFCCWLTCFSQKPLKPFKTGDRVVFAGNSITEAGLYESYIWLYYMTHFPNSRIDIFNAGIGGDVAGQIFDRLEGDILIKKPNILAMTFGMNDSKYFEYLDQKNPVTDEKRKAIIDESQKSYKKIEAKLKEIPGISPILVGSSPYDETAKIPGNLFVGKAKTMQGIIDFQRQSAIANNWGFIDFFQPMTEINKREQITQPAYTNTGPDRIHPGSAGHFIMAYLFLKAQGLASRSIADVKVDAASRRLVKSTNAKVTGIRFGKDVVSFDYLAKSLPYPIDTAARVWQNNQVQDEALKVIPFVKEFDQELIAFSGLKGKRYRLKIDNTTVGEWSAKQLAEGVNLAVIKQTPQYKQALKILALNNERRGVEAKYRNYFWVQYNFLKQKGLLFNNSKEARDTISNNLKNNGWLNAKKGDYDEIVDNGDKVKMKMEMLINEIYTINKPVTHHVRLEKI
ncbi:SGNH/GDSL hydrolase family protein [Pedobacter sandarakinus]|uniref:SGNH/GDSL hydrolase family protein n=1 Tax=Pedobacter sandarakinus TaxID=353156 RepID=UPI00224863E8|nr:SGNH/GDSL hydrolase family protein [Pedobacter sandarakinus]MCX2574111.1 SGNH/GDSL hydrolase family protein [Pedobacter sandarakinus]